MADDEKLGFYVFDNLRCSQDRAGGNVYRFDSLDDAIACYERMPKEWTTALGGSRNDLSDLDLVQRRMGASTLVTDFSNFPEWRDDPQVQQAIGMLVDKLGIGVMADRSIMGRPLLIPLDDRNPADDRYLADKKLRLREAAWPATAINEAFVRDEGWVSPKELIELSRRFGYDDPNCPFVAQLNVAYEADGGRVGQMDIVPREYGFLAERALGLDPELYGQGALFEHGTVNSLMGQIFQWKEAAAPVAGHEETLEQIARKAKERASERNAERPDRPQDRTRSHDMER